MARFVVREGWVVQAYRYALDPSPRQERALASHAGAARVAYNWAVTWVLATWAQRKAEESYGVPEAERTPWRGWSLPALRREWNQVKNNVAPWWAQNSKEAYSSGLAGAAAAFGNYAASKNGRRKGAPVGCPRRKTKHRSARSCRFTTGPIRVERDRHHVRLPRLGAIRTHESTRKLARRLEDGRARILSATVRQEACGRWYVSLQAEVARPAESPTRPGVAAGVDLGVSHLAVIADSLGGLRYQPNPQHLEQALSILRRRSRQMARRSGPVGCDAATGATVRQVPSAGWREARRSLARAHVRVRHLRADGIAKLTSALAAEYGRVVAEDLNVAGMLRNRRLARRIAGAGFGEIRRQLGYKTTWNGGQLVLADRWYPSSKTCSGCGVVKAKLPLRTRVFRCEACGLVLDRDLNAARNLAALAASKAGAPEWPGPGRVSAEYACGADRKTRRDDPGPTGAGGLAALKQEPGIPREQDQDRHQATGACRCARPPGLTHP
jgi:putative transposase